MRRVPFTCPSGAEVNFAKPTDRPGWRQAALTFPGRSSKHRPVAAGGVGHERWGAGALALLAGALLSIRLDEPGWFDNEGRFAEVAREMVVLHDWITPRVNSVPLLTKPPLTQWLAALVFQVGGPSEWARVVPIACAMLTVVI